MFVDMVWKLHQLTHFTASGTRTLGEGDRFGLGLFPAANDDEHSTVRAAVVEAVQRGDADALLEVLTSCEGEALPRDWQKPGETAAGRGDVQCLRVLRECGFELDSFVWVAAASCGHVDCLKFALNHGYVIGDFVLYDLLLSVSVERGRLADVAWVLERGPPREPFLLRYWQTCPDSAKCIELLLARGVAIDSKSLINAAANGDLAVVRMLHKHGIPLWRHAREPETSARSLPVSDLREPESAARSLPVSDLREPEKSARSLSMSDLRMLLIVPRCLDGTRGAWRALRYGSLYGAPVTPRVWRIFEEKRQRTRALLLCFKATTRLSNGPGCPEQRRVWAGMAALPTALVEEILICADFDIPESVMR